METETKISGFTFLQGGGEMGERTRSFDWSNTPVGSPETWPQSLKTIVSIVLTSRFPMFIWWGKDLIQFYNDAYRPSLGNNGKHPQALGQKAVDCWPEIWNIIYPLIKQVLTTGEATWSEDQFIPIYRNGKIEDVYWTFGYSPIRNDEGIIEGVLVICNETTKKVQTFKKLEESQKRFQNLIRDATIGIVVLSGEEMIVEIVNDAYGKIIDRTSGQLMGKPIFTVIPETEKYFRKIIEGVRTTGKTFYAYDHPYYVFTEGKKKEGFLHLVYQPYREEDGTVKGVMALCQDVTEQVMARKKIEDSENRVRSIVESTPFPVGVYIGRDMRIEMANQTIIEIWGKGNDVIGKKYTEVLPELEEQEVFKQIENVYTTGIPFHAKNQKIDLLVDGKTKEYFFNYSFTPLQDLDGNVYGVLNTAADVTDLNFAKQKIEQSERNFRNMILQAPVAMCILLGRDHIIEVANDSMIELWGKKKKEVFGKAIFEALPDAKEQGLEEFLSHVYLTGETFSANEMPVKLLRNGKWETVYQNFVYEPYKDATGTILGVLAISIDVTAQVLARQKIEEIVSERTRELANTNYQLEHSNAELAQFAYIASHDLQEPVRKVNTFAQMLDKSLQNVDERSKTYIEKIKSSSARMLTLIRDVLAYSELSNLEYRFVRRDLNQIIENIKNDFELIIEQKQAKIITNDLPAVEALPLHMSQLFSNLISNALKFSRPDVPPEIKITSSIISEEECRHFELDERCRYYKIEVEDNGIGFENEYVDQIFSIFQRLHGKSAYEGTGIGLAICQKIVQNHHGLIYARSELNKGSVFTVILPEKNNPVGREKTNGG
jgi:PAS domain S-box-containing protein